MKHTSDRCLSDRLRRELQLLRSIIPARPQSKGRPSSIVKDALEYIEEMQQQIQELDSFVQATSVECTVETNGFPQRRLVHDHRQMRPGESHVEVLSTEAGLEIHLTCDKSPGLLVAITEALEELGLAFEKVDIQCEDRLQFDAFRAKNTEGALVEAESVRRLMHLILEQSGPRTTTVGHSWGACGA